MHHVERDSPISDLTQPIVLSEVLNDRLHLYIQVLIHLLQVFEVIQRLLLQVSVGVVT